MAEKRGAGKVMKIDSSMDWERHLTYREKEAGWTVFRFLFWGIYVFVLGCMLIIAGFTAPNLMIFGGWALVLLAVFLVVYGFVSSLHYRLMRKHG